MAQRFRDLSIVEPRANPFTGAVLTDANIISAGCCQGTGERVFQIEKSDDDDLQLLSANDLSTGDIVIKFRVYPSANDDAVGVIFWRSDEHNYLELRLGELQLNKASLHRITNGVEAEVVSDTTITNLVGKVSFARIKFNSTTRQVQARFWLATTAEPNTWSINTTLSQAITTTETKYGFSQGYARSADWHWIATSDVASEPAYKTTIPANDSTTANLAVSGASYYHLDDEDGKGRPAIGATARLYHQATGVLLATGTTDNSARFSLSGIRTGDNCYATFTPPATEPSFETGIANLLMPARATTDSHTNPAGAPTSNPASFYLLHLRTDATNLARVGKTDGTAFTSSELFSLGDKLTGYLGFDTSGALIYGTWTITSLASVVAGRNYQLVYVDRNLPISVVMATANYDDRVFYIARTAAPRTTVNLTTQQENEVRELITAQSGTLLTNLVECFLTMGVERDSVIPDSVAVTTSAKALPNSDTLSAGGCTAVLVSGFDPLIIDDNHLLLLGASTAGVGIPAGNRLGFRLTTNGVPSAVEIYLAHTTTGRLLISRSSSTANVTLSIIAASLSGVGTIDHIKAVIEAAAGNKKIDQQSFQGLAHTVFYDGTATVPPSSFQSDAIAGSICIKPSTNQIFYRTESSSTPIARRDEIQFTTGTNGYRLGFFGTADRMPDDVLGFFFRGVSGSRGNYTIGLREDVLPTGIGSAQGSSFQVRWATGTNTPTGTWITFTRTRSDALSIDGHNYLYYGTPSSTTTTALGINQAYTMQFRYSDQGHAPIYFYPAHTPPVGNWVLLAGGGASTPTNRLLPAGGATGYVLKKRSSRDYDYYLAPDATGSGDTITVDATLKREGNELGLADSIVTKIDESYDFIRLIDDEFTLTPAVSDDKIGWLSGSYGTVSPLGDPQFSDGTNTWKITNIRTGTTSGARDLVIRVRGVPDVTADQQNVATIPKEVDFKIGDKLFRSRDINVEYVDADPNARPAQIAYIQFLFPNSEELFTSGTSIVCQVYLKGADASVLLPRAGRRAGRALRVAADNVTPVWQTPALAPALGGVAPNYLRDQDSDLSRSGVTDGLFQNVVIDGTNIWVFGGAQNTRTLSKIFKYSWPDRVYSTQFAIINTNNDLAEGFVHNGVFYSLRYTTRTATQHSFGGWLLTNWGTTTGFNLTNTTRLGSLITQGFFVTSDSEHFWVSNGNGVTNKYLKSSKAYISAGNITPTDTSRVYACSATDDDHVYLFYDDTADSTARKIKAEAYSKTDGSRKLGEDFEIIHPVQAEFVGFRTYGGAEIYKDTLYIVSNRTSTALAWAEQTPDVHIADVARETIGKALTDGDNASDADISFNYDKDAKTYKGQIKPNSIVPADVNITDLEAWKTRLEIAAGGGAASKTDVVPSLTVNSLSEATIATRVLEDSLKLYFELGDFRIREQLTVTHPTVTANDYTNTYRVVIRDSSTNAPIARSLPFTILGSTPQKIVMEIITDSVPDSYLIRLENMSSTNKTVTNLSSIVYPRTRIQYDNNSATRLNPAYYEERAFRQENLDYAGFALPTSTTSTNQITRSNFECLAHWPIRDLFTAVNAAGQVNQFYNATYSAPFTNSSYQWTIPDAGTPAYCTWDDTGQYFYYVKGGASPVLRCFDMTVDAVSGTPTPTRITSREFDVTSIVSGQTGIFGIGFVSNSLGLLVYDGGTNYILQYYRASTNASGTTATIPIPVTGAVPVGMAVSQSRIFIAWQIYPIGIAEVISYDHSRRTQPNESFPLIGSSVSSLIKDITVNDRLTSTSAIGADPIFVGYNPIYSADSIISYTTRDRLTAARNQGYRPLSTLDATAATNRYLYQIIEDPSTGKLYFLYGAQSRYWTDDSILYIERRTSYDNPTVEANSAVYGNSYGWRSDAPLAGGFLKGTKIYMPRRNDSTGRFYSVDLANNFQLSTTPDFTVSYPNDGNTRNQFTCWGNGTTFWVQKYRNVYAFNVSDYSRDPSKDFTVRTTSGWGTSAQSNFLTGDTDHVIEGRPSGTFILLYYRRKEDAVYVKTLRVAVPESRQGFFINQFVPNTVTGVSPNDRGWSYYASNRATPVYGNLLVVT